MKLTDINYVKGLQSNLRAVFATPPGVEIMKFLERLSGWYDFHESDPDKILIAHGKRQVLATIKTLIDASPEQIVTLAVESDQIG